MTSIITTKQALANLATQAGNTKQSSLLLLASVIMTHIAFGEERKEEAQDAVRGAFIASGFVRIDKGTKQPSDKARRFIATAEAAVKHHNDKIRALMVAHSNTTEQTETLATWCASFALSPNHYEGNVYLMPLTLGISKKEAKERIAEKQAKAPEDSEVTHVKPQGKLAAPRTKQGPSAPAVLTTAASVEGVISAIRSMVRVKKGEKPSQVTSGAVVRLFSEMDTVCRLVRGEDVTSATKDARRLAVEVAKHYAAFKTLARKHAKAKDVIAIKASKKAA